IYSLSTRGEQQNTRMSTNTNAKYRTRIAGNEVYFAKASDDDQIVAMATDHNFRFYAYYPYAEANTDMSEIAAQVPTKQLHATGVENYGLYVATKQVTTIVSTVDLDFKAVFSTVELYLPNDIIDEAGNS